MMTCQAKLVLSVLLGATLDMGSPGTLAPTDPPAVRWITIEECIRTALLRNRALQIQRLNPEIARSTLSSSRGYYDPLFTADVRWEGLSDSGGYDPADFSRDAVYTADSEVAKLGLTGVLPTGLRYFAGGSYANSFGTRNWSDFDSYNLFAGITLQQPLLKNLWIDQGRLTIQVNKTNLKITELGVVYLTADVINQVQQAYYELLAAREHLRAQMRLVQMRERFLAGVQRQVDVGMLTPADTQVAKAQLAAAYAEAVTATNLVTLAQNALKTQLGDSWTDSANQRLTPREPLTLALASFDLARSWERGLSQRPDLAQLRQDLERAEIDLKYRRNQLFPSLDLVAGYGRRGASTMTVTSSVGPGARASATEAFDQIADGDNPNDMIGFLFALPLSRTADRANYRAGKQLRAQAELLVKQKEELVMREISDALNTARTGLDRVQATGRTVRFAQAALAAEERKLAGGKSTLFFVLQLQRDLVTAETAEIRAKADYNKAVSQLRFADASVLDANHIVLECK